MVQSDSNEALNRMLQILLGLAAELALMRKNRTVRLSPAAAAQAASRIFVLEITMNDRLK